MEGRPILSYLIAQNTAKGNSHPEEITVESDQTDVVSRLAQLMISAQATISRCYRSWRLRKYKLNKIYVVDIYFDENINNHDHVYLVGDFTPRPWVDRIKMDYSYLHKAFRAQVQLKDLSQFKFIVNGEYCCSKYYKSDHAKSIDSNNLFKLNKPSKRVMFQRYISKSQESTLLTPTNRYTASGSLKHSITVDKIREPHTRKCSEVKSGMFSFTQMCKNISGSNKASNKPKGIKHPNSEIYSNKKRNKLSRTRQGASVILPTSVSAVQESRLVRKSQLQRLNTMNNSIFNDLVTPLIRGPETVFDVEFFDTSYHSPSSDKYNRNYEDTIRLIQSNKERYATDPRLSKSYSTDTICEDEYIYDFKFMAAGNLMSKSKSKLCEDAYFTHPKAVGIADGVGGWSRFGIDCSKFSNELMKRCQSFCKNFERMKKFTVDLVKSSEFQMNFGDIYNTISSEMRSKRLHSNSFCNIQQGGENQMLKSNSSVDIMNNSFDILMDKSQKLGKTKSPFSLEPKTIIKDSCNKMKNYGSSTVCVCTIQKRMLKVANLGDSGLLLLRYNVVEKQSKVILCTKDQHHAFNTPFQVAKIPKDCYKLFSGKKNSKLTKEANIALEKTFWNDSPDLADTYQARIKHNDIVILGTDGLFDNLFLDDILDIVDNYVFMNLRAKGIDQKLAPEATSRNNFQSWFSETNAKELSVKLTKAARKRSKCMQTISPFEKKCNDFLETNNDNEGSSKSYDQHESPMWQGGKKDDIGVVVAFIN